jgi:hypothetical protein
MFWVTMYPLSGETTVFMRHLVFVILKQVDRLKLQGRTSENEGCYLQASDKISIKFLLNNTIIRMTHFRFVCVRNS